MSSRTDAKAHARAEREARERAAAQHDHRRRQLLLFGGIAAGVVAIVVVAIVLAGSGGKSDKGTSSGRPAGAAATTALFAGIPQNGVAVGNPKAPVTLTEFGDLQCPFCAQFATSTLPDLVTRYVRTGKVRIVFRNLQFIGDDSRTAAQAASGAAQQNKLWQFVDLFYKNQGEENTGYVTDAFLRKIASGVPGLNADEAISGGNAATTKRLLATAEAEARSFNVTSTPSFLIARTGGTPRKLEVPTLSIDSFSGPIDTVLKGT